MKPLVYSYTLLNTWDICPHQCYRRYIARDLPPEVKTQQQLDGIEAHQAIERRVRQGKVLPEHMKHLDPLVAPLDPFDIEPEQKLGVTEEGASVGFWDKGVWLRGALDAPVLTAPDTALLVDWKTGKRREDPFELEVGAVLLQAAKPMLRKIYGVYIWLRDGVKGTPHDLSDTARTWGKVHERVNEIETAIEDSRFTKTPGPLCAWCSVMDCQHNRVGK